MASGIQEYLLERMLAAKRKNGGQIIVADPRRTPTVRQGADLHLQLRVGTNVALMNGLIHLLIARNWVNRDFISKYTVGFEQLDALTREYRPECVAEICDIPRSDLETAAEWIGTTPRMVSTVLQGFYQNVEATAEQGCSDDCARRGHKRGRKEGPSTKQIQKRNSLIVLLLCPDLSVTWGCHSF